MTTPVHLCPAGIRAPCGVRWGTKAKFTTNVSAVTCRKCLAFLSTPTTGEEP